ncbi:MAG: hypothetical protein PHR77_19675 [Kiritimatiellae bacterium]|nr:hypothetical protein [Kiritimatiellia bacterium]MDD5522758.1 hypothetical protein [Kiritimatiellia bacterium]
MKYTVGYQLPEEDEKPFIEVVRDFKNHIAEVYFPWMDMASGRLPLTVIDGFVDWEGQKKLESDLKALKRMGVKLDLLLNANCYGRESLSQHFANNICSVVSHLCDNIGLDVVTTTSLMVARTIKENFPGIDVRASVNMRIGTVKGMEYVVDYFDSYYVQREYNRNLQKLAELGDWAKKHKKRLYFLVNSGCMNFCSGQVFHDNLVAHEKEICETANIQGWNQSVCWNYYAKRDNWVSILQNSWIRPEDIHHYKQYFPMAKLATRMHDNPRKVIQAYVEESFVGNLLDLFEPGHGPIFLPYVIDNTRFPKNWFKKTTTCDKKCQKCGFCSQVLGKVLVKIDEL